MAFLMTFFDLLALLSFFVILRAIRDHRRRRGLPHPPGPRPWPLIGNLFDIPKESPWLTYAQLSKKYGDVISFNVFGQTIVILGSIKVTKDLFEKRGDTYSDRPVFPFIEMMDLQWALPMARHAEPWRLGRKLLERSLRPVAAAAYRLLQEKRAHVLLSRLLESPDKWVEHIELFQGEQLLAMTYGYEAQGSDDRVIDAAKKMSDIASTTSLPGACLVNEFPFLRHIPEWLPWFSYKPLARIGHDLGQEVMNDPIQFVRESILNGTAQPSLALENFEAAEKLSGVERKKQERAIAETLGSMYTAGSDTSVASMMSLFLAFLLRPDVQRKAQEDIDAVTGRERLPTFEDRPKLPFVDAICKEVSRWMPVAPLHIPHAATQDGVYEGFFIPKGALLIANTWAILHDPAVYPEPDIFKPERFLNPNGTLREDPTLVSAFGYGKRFCPGRHFAEATLFIVAVSVLSVFNLEKGGGSENRPFDYSYSSGLISRPNTFPCSFIPRDQKAIDLLIADSLAR
ncbi:cytochrome P450 [Multifurca ochricompacta]|uniref:Cytochrome P450 n=1 Tax=Multifurca ochricompacta TaxID=376703 RepID=A0AAD4QLR1_9AGAM|nr:cytochrome P450 [Multifurca ochricompacta]